MGGGEPCRQLFLSRPLLQLPGYTPARKPATRVPAFSASFACRATPGSVLDAFWASQPRLIVFRIRFTRSISKLSRPVMISA